MVIKYSDDFLNEFEEQVIYFKEVEAYEGMFKGQLVNRLYSGIQEIEDFLLLHPYIKTPDKYGISKLNIDDFKRKISIHYRINGDVIEFLNLFHSSRKPLR